MSVERFVPRRLADYSDESLLAEIRRVAALVPPEKFLSRTEFNKHSLVHTTTLDNRFGSWQKALEAAGCGNRYDHTNQRVPNEDLIAELRRVAAKIGSAFLTKREFDEHGRYCNDIVVRRFGSWRAALNEAGLNQKNLGRRYSDEECFENLLRVWTHHGRAPFHREMKDPPSTVGPKAYVLRWGTWNKAIHAFAERVNADIQAPVENSVPVTQPILQEKRTIPDSENREIKLGLCYAVLKRDHFKCVLCGDSPSRNPLCVLHVDHIVPVPKGGKTVIENLRALCEACNLGKGNKTE